MPLGVISSGKLFIHNREGTLGRDFPNFLGFCNAFRKRQQQLAVAARHKAKREKESGMLFKLLKWNGTDAF